ncbi:hypothetical protein [Halobacillus amylolyticus]|uniref:Uncharacterized protein n=1 Tax=Halobacillus amylolyticus TaxID=2932259 RepID=A0ABY4HDA0_9BACI|nr:hypothetical protein [Halobacillus amylolyticus]UOR12864.1 hypothetical protein MUO15_04965 [Halobacillus amylolyticus]
MSATTKLKNQHAHAHYKPSRAERYKHSINQERQKNAQVAKDHGFSVLEYMESTGKKPLPTDENGVILIDPNDPNQRGGMEDFPSRELM